METVRNSQSDDAVFYDAICNDLIDPTSWQDEDGEDKNPNFEIARLKFLLTLPEYANDEEKKNKLVEWIKNDEMAPYYERVYEELKWKRDKNMLKEMQEANKKALESLESEIEYAQNNLGTIDIKVAYVNKAAYLSKIGNKDDTIKTLAQAYDHTVALGCKLDNVFHCIKIGLFFNDLDLIKRNLSRSEQLIEEGADWHYRNCFKIYTGLYSLATRDFTTACDVFTSVISTFVCTELISLSTFIKYTVYSAMLILKRNDLQSKIMKNSDILQALHRDNTLKQYLFSFYNSEFKDFFKALAEVEIDMRQDALLHAHYHFYVKEMKIKAYDQLLSTYISLNLSYMADRFGVTEEYLEEDMTKLIAAKRLNYKIDRVSGNIVNMRSDKRQEMLENVIKNGDVLLNRIHKLSRVVNI
ncbi:26S proteasome non-ATPase regulatory subunit 6-like [Sitophilus oryzae]|uniref:26S proteasome non-ATPase regulatory subunit 6 n=1 Tax=Sitophilus oryzae TaxID=7048 RepID=A0A6J2YB34_SITOR|nr:26S proteasome non-ATPase regulatory subunit 6-like [Sitophilus oryzae]